MMSIPVRSNFCERGLEDVYSDIRAGSLPFTALCGAGVGCCTFHGEHSAVCLARFHAMNLTASVPELSALLSVTHQSRAMPELNMVLALVPALCESAAGLCSAPEIFPEPFRCLLADRPQRPSDWSRLPLGVAQCLSTYLNHLDGRPFRHSLHCPHRACPFKRIRSALNEISLPAEVTDVIFGFLCA